MEVSLNPDYFLKWDIKRVVLYSKSDIHNEGTRNWCSFLHPLHALILGTFACEHNFSKAIELIKKYCAIKVEVIEKFILRLIDNTDFSHLDFDTVHLNLPPNLLLSGKYEHSQHNIQNVIQKVLAIREIDLEEPRLLHTPLKIIWMANNHCPVNCIYCYADVNHKHKELSLERFEQLMTEAKDCNISECEVIGGDFFVKKDWDIYLRCLQNYGFTPPYISTKKALSSKEIQLLIKIGYNGILQFSLDSFSQSDLKDIIHCSDNYLDNVKEMFAILNKEEQLPFKVRVNTVLIARNATERNIQELMLFLSEFRFVVEWEIRFSMPAYSKVNNFLCGKKQIEQITPFLKELAKNKSFAINVIEDGVINNKPLCDLAQADDYDNRCTANLRHCFILPDGKVTICERLYWNPLFIIGDLNESTLSEIWNSGKAKKLAYNIKDEIAASSLCYMCDGKNLCYRKNRRCWVDVVNKWGGNITYPDPICKNSLKQTLQ